MNTKKYFLLTALLISVISGGAAGFASAQTPPTGGQHDRMGAGMRMQPGVFGTVSAISGTTITINSKGRPMGPNGGTTTATPTTYTVDASSATVTKNGAASSVSGIAIGDTVMIEGTVSGTSVTAKTIRDGVMQGMQPGVFGTVSAISGNTITITSKGFGKNTATTTYTIDATNATVTKDGATSSVSAISVGDMIMVQGTVSGTSVTATKINDGMGKGPDQQTPVIAGNGQPIVAGKVTTVSGNTITISNSSNVTYTVDVSNAKFAEDNTLVDISKVTTGEMVVVQGTVNGNSITAYSVTIQGKPMAATAGQRPGMGNMFSAIGGAISKLFKNLFGF